MTLVNLLTVLQAKRGQRDIAVVRLFSKALFLEQADRFVDRGLRHPHLFSDINRSNGVIDGATEHDDRFKVVLV